MQTVNTLSRQLTAGLLLWPWLAGAAPPPDTAEQKIIFIRHGEKPEQGLGQINCQGLNRALALPAVLARFGKPDFVFAADPHEQKKDGEQSYNYVRPLLTIAPAAVQWGLPINTSFGYENIRGLQQELAAPRYQNALVVVAWEHRLLEDMVRDMLQRMGGQAGSVPRWKGSDFDSIYIVTVRRSRVNGAEQASASFALEHQQLDGLDSACPVPALPAQRKP